MALTVSGVVKNSATQVAISTTQKRKLGVVYTATAVNLTGTGGGLLAAPPDNAGTATMWSGVNTHPTLSSGLVSFYRLNSGGDDSTANALHGTLQGSAGFIIGKHKNCMQVNANGNYLLPTTGGAFDLNYITVSAWVSKHSSVDWGTIISKRTQNGLTCWHLGYRTNVTQRYEWIVENTSGSSVTCSATVDTTATNCQWIHLAGTYDGTNAVLYVNGVAGAPQALAGTLRVYANLHPIIGAMTESTSSPAFSETADAASRWVGRLDEIGIWNRAATADEVSDLYNDGYGLTRDRPTNSSDVVVCGGLINAGGTSNQTWIWNGTARSWTQKAISVLVTKPGAISNHVSAYDSVNKKSLVYGGLGGSDRTYLWDGILETWAQVAAGGGDVKPFAGGECQAAAACFDSSRNRVVHFGGYQGAATNNTYEWNGSIWILMAPVAKPNARWFHAMAFDSSRNVTVMFGGMTPAARQDIWEYNGTTWTQKTPVGGVQPSARSQTAMAYDPVNQRILLFGGTTGGNETWSWNGATETWTQLVTGGVEGTDKPTSRYGHAMACDYYNNNIVLYSGNDGTNNTETWIWNGTVWAKLTIAGSVPPSLRDHSMCACSTY
jgi:hypothetical protein